MKKIAIIGSTGSIGTQTLEVISAFPCHFKVAALACGSNIGLLERQIRRFKPAVAAVYSAPAAGELKRKLSNDSSIKTKILSGPAGLEAIASGPAARMIVFAASGLKTLKALRRAIRAGKEIALANKEMVVADGTRIMGLAQKHKITIVPVDSEHSAIFQCLRGEDPASVEKVILTCSGGPFHGKKNADLKKITAAQACSHPVWRMGKKISVDSATLMNKGFEIIEAMHLFGLRQEQIEVVIHPECIVHALVQFKDGNTKALLAPPDMRLPILYALAYPRRFSSPWPALPLSDAAFSFYKPDYAFFKGPLLARAAAKKGGKAPEVLTLANEKAVNEFLGDRIRFDEIYPQIEKSLKNML